MSEFCLGGQIIPRRTLSLLQVNGGHRGLAENGQFGLESGSLKHARTARRLAQVASPQPFGVRVSTSPSRSARLVNCALQRLEARRTARHSPRADAAQWPATVHAAIRITATVSITAPASVEPIGKARPPGFTPKSSTERIRRSCSRITCVPRLRPAETQVDQFQASRQADRDCLTHETRTPLCCLALV